jgi:hypothetical protein
MLVVGVEEESVVDVAWVGRGVPEKPMTALISKSFCITIPLRKLYFCFKLPHRCGQKD